MTAPDGRVLWEGLPEIEASGHAALQQSGSEAKVEFRKIEIKELGSKGQRGHAVQGILDNP